LSNRLKWRSLDDILGAVFLVVYVCSHVLICFLEVDLILVDCGLTGNTSVGFAAFIIIVILLASMMGSLSLRRHDVKNASPISKFLSLSGSYFWFRLVQLYFVLYVSFLTFSV
jgi:hypothetical protein